MHYQNELKNESNVLHITPDIRESFFPPDTSIQKWAASVRPKYVEMYGDLAEANLSKDSWLKYED